MMPQPATFSKNMCRFLTHIHVRVLTQTQTGKEVGSSGLQIIGMEGDIYRWSG